MKWAFGIGFGQYINICNIFFNDFFNSIGKTILKNDFKELIEHPTQCDTVLANLVNMFRFFFLAIISEYTIHTVCIVYTTSFKIFSSQLNTEVFWFISIF